MKALVPPSWAEEVPEGPTGVSMKKLQNGVKVSIPPILGVIWT